MADVIWGDVVNVVDGDTFDVNVTHPARANKMTYNNQERIRIAGIDAPEIPSASGLRAKHHVEKHLLGKHVKLTIQSRDTYGRLVCDVTLADKD